MISTHHIISASLFNIMGSLVNRSWGNIDRFPVANERNRSGGAGIYYHVGPPGLSM